MSIVFTQTGMARHLRKIDELQTRLWQTGQELGQEAGINSDWHDNFGYEDARRRFDQESQQLAALVQVAQQAVVADPKEQSDEVAIGVTVALAVDNHHRKVTIGGYGESDPRLDLISYAAPMARALMGLRVGDETEIISAGKTRKVRIVDIFPPSHRYSCLAAATE